MNYIAHIHIGQITSTSLVGNFLGDFVKGSQLSHLSNDLQLGIRLHRKIDLFTDQHSGVKQLKLIFPAHLQRVAGIALDIYFDHLLLHNWSTFSVLTSACLFEQFYQQLQPMEGEIGDRFERVKQGLLRHKWLESYVHETTCLQAMQSIEQRLKGKIIFAEQAYGFLCSNRRTVESAFLPFYADLLDHSLAISTKL